MIHKLSNGRLELVSASDWLALSMLSQPRFVRDVRHLFYPGTAEESGSDQAVDAQRLRTRSPVFLAALEDHEYSRAYEEVLKMQTKEFVDIQSLKNSKEEGRVMSLVMSHVGWWLNSSPAIVVAQEKNKPLLRKDFLPALEKRHGDEADKQSILLQRKIALFSRTRLKDLTDIVCEPLLNQLPDGKEGYEKRFSHQVWKDLFDLVRSVTGPNFQGQSVARMYAQDVKSISPQPLHAVAEAMCSAASRV